MKSFVLATAVTKTMPREETCCMGNHRSLIKRCPGLRSGEDVTTARHGKQENNDIGWRVFLHAFVAVETAAPVLACPVITNAAPPSADEV